MPTDTLTTPTVILAAELAAAVGITGATGAHYQFTDAYRVTYTGTPSHLALSALARRDLTASLYRGDRAARAAVRVVARRLIDWFTSPYVDPEHATRFAALSPMRVCELVAYVANHPNGDALSHVGPESLRHYTGHLLHDRVPSAEHPFPRLIDKPRRSLAGGADAARHALQITATAADGAEDVAVNLNIEASEDISWEFVAAIPIPVDELNLLLMDPDWHLDDYISDNRELIDEYLIYRDSQTQEGISVNATLADPTTAPTYDQTPVMPIPLELFFVGTDQETALATTPFTRRADADHCVRAGERVFTLGVEVDIESLRAA